MSFVSRFLDPGTVERLNHLQLSARRVVEGATTGMHRSPVKGASIDFRQHRAYVPGDEPRRLDWRILGRSDKPFVREYDQETNLRAVILLDGSGSMGYGGAELTKLEYACRVVACLSYLMLAQTESVGLGVAGAGLGTWLGPRGGTAQMSRIVDVLERVGPHGASDLAAAMHWTTERLDRRALVIIVSDFFSPLDHLKAGLAHLGHDGHEVMALQILDEDELTFPFRHWTLLSGLEGEAAALSEPAMVRQGYLDNFNRHQEELSTLCASRGVRYRRMITRDPVIQSLIEMLNPRHP